MADRSVRVTLSLIASGFAAEMAKAKASTDQLIGSLERQKQAASTVGTSMMTAGAAILAGVGVATKAYADFDRQMSSVKSTGKDAAANFDALREAAIRAGAETSFSASEAAQGIEELAKAGLSAKDVLSGGLDGALALAAAGTISVGEAAEITAVSLKQFQLGGQDATRVADLLAAGAGKSVGEVTDLAAALRQSGTVANQYGISINETVGTLAMFAENALVGSDAGTSFKQMLLQLASPTDKAQAVLDKYNITAYDAQGNFVGMERFAGQLQDRLGGLSQEQQNAALKTIFGADAIRAATILMQQGASGVREWTAAVSEQGYAAEMARTKLDNLAGDLEALGGAFESAFIRSGSGVNDFLRGTVQGVTDLVNVIGNLPGPVLTVSAGLAGLAGAGLLVGGGMARAITTFADTRAAIGTLREEFPRLDKAMGKLSWTKAIIGAAALTAGLIALTAAQDANRNAFDDLIVTADDLGAKLQRTADYGQILNDAFTLETQGLFSGVTKEVDGLGEALARVLKPNLGQGFEDVMNGFLTGGSAASQMRTQIAELDRTLAGMVTSGNGEQAEAIFNQVAEAALAQGIEVAQLAPLFEAYSGALRGTSGPAGAAVTGAEALAGALGETAASATETAEALIKAGNAMLALSGSQIGYEAALDSATAAIQEHGQAALDAAGMIDISSAAGQALQGALDGVASAALSAYDNMVKTGASTAEVSAHQQRAAGDFLATAGAMGVGTAQAVELARRYELIPDEVATAVTAPGAQLSRQQTIDLTGALMAVPRLTNAQVLAPGARPSKADVDAFVRSVGTVPGLTTAQIRTIADLYGVSAAKAAIASVEGKTVYVRTVYTTSGTPQRAGLQNRVVADGALFVGPKVQQYMAAGGFASIGHQQPRIRPAGGAGITWAEDGAGPWEAFISGHPGKRRRSRWLLEEVAHRLGGDVSWGTRYADGGIRDRYVASPYVPPTQVVRMPAATAGAGVTEVRVFVGDREITDIVRTEIRTNERREGRRTVARQGVS